MVSNSMSAEKLRAIYGEVGTRAAAKEISTFDKHCEAFIAHSTFIVLATSNGSNVDVSPKGDPAGFVKVESETSLLIPDRLGNNRLDGLLNILRYPQVSILFLIPTVTETLRVNGRAEILDDPIICEQFAVKGQVPKTVTRVVAEKIFTHCGKAPLRAGLWQQDTWPSSRPVATLLEMVRDHSNIPTEEIDQPAVDKLYEDTMY